MSYKFADHCDDSWKYPSLNATEPPQATPAPGMATWQCPGCGRIYTILTDSCACQMHRWQSSSTTIKLDPMKVGR
jgi:hypothetical protein